MAELAISFENHLTLPLPLISEERAVSRWDPILYGYINDVPLITNGKTTGLYANYGLQIGAGDDRATEIGRETLSEKLEAGTQV